MGTAVKSGTPNYLYMITYLCRVEGDAYSVYDNRGQLREVLKKTHLIERDCLILHKSVSAAQEELERTDDCFIRILQVQVIQPFTVVHVLDRSTNYVEKK